VVIKEEISILESRFLLNLIVEDNIVKGATFLNIESGEVDRFWLEALL